MKKCGTCGHRKEGRCEICKKLKRPDQTACRLHATSVELAKQAKRRAIFEEGDLMPTKIEWATETWNPIRGQEWRQFPNPYHWEEAET